MSDNIIQLEHLNFWYNKGEPSETQALTDVNMEIERGEYVAFFGPSGSGKTTLLYLISGVEASQEGKIIVNDRDITGFSNQELAIYRQIGIGIIFQQFNLITTLTVLNNVALPMSFLGISENKRQGEAMKILTRLGIDHLANRFPGELSGGQQQRVGIARALSNNAPIIVADEPLGNLDSENSNKVLEFLKELHEKDNRTIIMVTHEAWSLRDVQKVFHVKDGKVVKVEKTDKATLAKSLSENLSKELSPKTETEKIALMLGTVFLKGFTREEVSRFEELVNKRLSMKIDVFEFFQTMNKPFKDGGVGLYSQTAHRISNYVEDIVVKRKEILTIIQKLKKNPQIVLIIEMNSLRRWLLLEYHGKIDQDTIEKFDEVLLGRLRETISQDDFKHILSLPKTDSGLGFTMHTTEHITTKLELILGSEV